MTGLTDHVFAFVGGLHRSGTTPMARALAGHAQVSGFSGTGVVEDEGQHLQSVYPPARAQGGPGRFALSDRVHLTERSDLVSTASAGLLFEQWQPHWDLSRPVLLEKSPPNLVMSRFLQALFPSARFIMVVRHPVIVALSTKKWARKTPLSQLLDHWFQAHDVLREDAPHVRHLHAVKYEDFVSRPDEALGGIATFLGLDGAVSADSVDPARSTAYAQAWHDMQTSSSWFTRRRMTGLYGRFEERANSYGYSLLVLEQYAPLRLPLAGGRVPDEASPRPPS